MGFDPVEVAILAIASIIGAVGAALVWGTFTKVFRIRRRALTSFGFLLIGAVSGLAFLFDYIEPVLAGPLVRVLPDSIYFEEVLEGARFEDERFGLQKGAGLTADYFSRAQGEDLVELMVLQGKVFGDLEAAAPELCYPFLFGLEADEAQIALRMDEEIPLDLEQHTQDLILNAATTVPTFDRELGEFLVRKAQVQVALDYGEIGVQMMSGDRRPQSEDEARELCAIYSQFLTAVSSEGSERAEAAWRSLFASSDQS